MSGETSESFHPFARPALEPEVKRAMLSRIAAGTRIANGGARARAPLEGAKGHS